METGASVSTDPIDPTRVREAVEKMRRWLRLEPVKREFIEDIVLVMDVALDALTQRDTVREQSEAMARMGEQIRQMDEHHRKRTAVIRQLRSELEAANQRTVVAREARDQIRDDRDQLQRELEAARAETERQRKNALNAADLVDARNELCTVLQRQLSTAQADAQGLRSMKTALHPFAKLAQELDTNPEDTHNSFVYWLVTTFGDNVARISMGDLRAARAALVAGGEEG